MTDRTIDLTNCDREQIHLPGLIQPHGVLFVLQELKLEIIQVSSNSHAEIGRQPEELLGKPLSDLLNPKQIKLIQQCLAEDFESINPLYLSIKQQNKSIFFEGIVHRLESVIILELERKKRKKKQTFLTSITK
jgi:two-component system, chemotaxis family, sensor kinase Cph1